MKIEVDNNEMAYITGNTVHTYWLKVPYEMTQCKKKRKKIATRKTTLYGYRSFIGNVGTFFVSHLLFFSCLNEIQLNLPYGMYNTFYIDMSNIVDVSLPFNIRQLCTSMCYSIL